MVHKNKALALAFAALAHMPLVWAGCLSLKGSQGCPGFSQEYISTNATSRFAWYPKNNIEAFDKALIDYVSGQANLDEFQSVFRCSGLDDLGGFNSDHGKAVIRYHRSIICADIIFSGDNLNECYSGKPKIHRRKDTDDGGDDAPERQLTEVLASSAISVRPAMPIPLCRSTCDTWIDSLHSIITNSTLCQDSSGINREASLDSLRSKCNASAYNGAPGRCIQGDENEPETCGYQRVEDWCKYCKFAPNYYDTCASVGVLVGKSDAEIDNNDAGTPTKPGGSNHPHSSLVSQLKKEARQERVFRIVAIVLSVIVGLCLIVLIIIVAFCNRKQLPAMILAKKGMPGSSNSNGEPTSSGRESRDDSTLLHLGADAHPQTEKDADFVDCFISVVGKPRQVIRHFFSRRDDEISLHQGDIVTLQMAFDDGWVVGKNLTTGCEGTFPLMCVMEKLPATVPAQWSVLPESNSVENIRRPSRAATRPISGQPLPEQESLSAPLPAREPFTGNVSRMSNLSAMHEPVVITTSRIPQSPYQRSTRVPKNDSNDFVNTGMDVVDSGQKQGKGQALLGRLLGAFAPSSQSSAVSSGSDADAPGFFKRLLVSPLSGRERPPAPEALAAKPGRPHSFNVNHVVHIGLTDPNYPRLGDTNTSVSTFPSTTRQSVNGYPMIVDQGSSGYPVRRPADDAASIPGFPRQPNFSYGEFAPSNSSQITTGNASAETYHTAEQFAQHSLGQMPPTSMPAPPFR
ncbi:hypothetical protein GGI25_001027 [Coemansia spiralis]|uniref:SH3 domain-containing protein n=2 Tax=Coemansia TaxID=4863 RepID=A0A9W8L0K4_9FUNG|nr:hypothetical protein EDC05_003897 [Coemansia umbellata]KAJ2621617.1 hypothetical protein GGI26_003951 [Coemansia sp. RSA 1358]KAJ2680136.1 hypothetical protein GGI25_001027 [Coemansia spiralis]